MGRAYDERARGEYDYKGEIWGQGSRRGTGRGERRCVACVLGGLQLGRRRRVDLDDKAERIEGR